MANSVGAVYLDILPRLTELNKQVESIKQQRNDLVFRGVLNAAGLTSQINKATAGLGRTVDISANLSVKGLEKLKTSYGTFATFAGTSLSNALSSALDKASQTVTQIVGAGVGFSKDSVNSFRDVSSQLNIIQQKAGASQLQLKQLEQAIISTSANTSLLPEGAAELADTLATAGLRIDTINKLLRPLAAGSAGLGRSAALLGGDVATLSNAFNLNAGRDGNTIINAIAATATAANLTADQLANSTRYFRSQQEGLAGVAETFSSVALLAQGGITGSSAGTGLNALFTQAIKNSEKLKTQLNVDIRDRNGNLKRETQILDELREAYLRLQQESGTADALGTATSLFQTRGARALQAYAKLSDDTINKTIASVKRFETEDIAGNLEDAALKGLGGAFLELDNTIASFQFSIGSKLSPAVEAVVRSISKVFAEIASNEPLLNSIGESAQRFADALSAPQVQEALVRVGQILTGLIQSGVDYIAKQTLAIGEAIQRNPEILENIAKTISNIVAATFELLAGLIQIGLQIASAIAPLVSVSGIVSTLKLVISEVINLVTTFFAAFNAGAGESVLAVTNLQSAIKLAGQLLQPVAALFGGISGTIARIAVSAIDLVENSGLVTFTTTLTRNITSLFRSIQTSVPGIVRTIGTALTSFGSGLSSGFGRVNIDSPNLQLPQLNIADAARGFGEVIGEIGARIFNVASRISEIVVNRIVPALLKIGEALAPVANSLLTTVFDLVSKLVPLIEKAINLTINFITNNLPGLQQFLLQAADFCEYVNGFVVGIVAELIKGVSQSTTLQNLWTSITTFAGQLLANVKSIFEAVSTNLNSLEGLRSLVASIAGFVGTVLSGVINLSTNLARASASVSGIQTGFSRIVGFIGEQAGKFGEFFDSITKVVEKLEFFPRLGQSAGAIFGNLTDGLNVFISTLVDKASPALDPLFKAVEEASPKILNLILKLGEWASQFSVAFAPAAEFVGTVLGNAVRLAGKLLANLIGTVGKVAEFISTNERIQQIINFVTNAVGVIFKTLTSVSNTITSIQGNIIDGIYPILEFVTLGVVKILDTISNIGYKVLVFVIEKLTQIGSWVSGLIENLLPTIQKLVVSFWEMLNEKWNAFWTAVSQWFTKTLPEAIAATYTRIIDTVNLVNEAINKFFAGVITWLAETFTNTVRSVYEFVTNTIKTVGEYISNWFGYIIKWITETFWQTVTSVYDFINSIVKSIGDYLSSWFNYVIGWITDTFAKTIQSTQEYVSSVIKYLGETVSGWFNYVIEWITKAFTETVKFAYDTVTGWINALGKTVSDWFAWAINWLFKTLPDTIKGLYDKVIAWWNSIATIIGSWFNSVIKLITETIPQKIQEGLDKAKEIVLGLFTYIWRKIMEVANYFTGGLQQKITDGAKGLTDKFGSAIKTVSNLWNSFGNAVSNIGSSIANLGSNSSSSSSSPKGANAEAIKAALGGRPVKLGSNEQIFNQAGLGTPLVTTVKAFENFYERAYADGRQISIGFGTKARSRNETITVEDANIRLRDELLKARKEVEDIVVRGYGRQLNQGQLDALTSFAYNLGGGALRTLFDNGRRSNAVVAEKIKLYNKADLLDGKGMRVLEGLRIRRNFESDMFKGIYGGVADAAAQSKEQADQINNLFKSTNVLAPIKLPTLRSNTLPGLQHFGAPRAGGTRLHAGFDTDHANDANSVVQAILGGEIIRVAAQRDSSGRLTGYGNYIDIYNKALGVVERIAEFDKRVFTEADVGKTIRAGAIVGRGTTFRGVDHREIRDIEKYRTAPFGYNSARDPAAYLVGLRLYERTPQGSLVPTGQSISQQVRSGYGGAVDTIQQANEISSRVLQSIGGTISTQAIADFTESLALTLSNIESQKLTSRVQPDALTEADSILKELTDQTGIQLSQGVLNQLTDTLASAIATATGLEYNANAVAPALVPATAGTTPGTSVYGLILEGLNKAADLLQSLDLNIQSLLSFANQLTDYLYSIRQRVLGKVNVGLASADSENFQLLTQGRQSLQEQRFLSDRLPRLFSLQQQQTTTTGVPGGINQQEDGARQYSFTDNIRRIAEYAQMLYEMIGQKLGLINLDTNNETVPRLNTSEYATPLLEALTSIENKLTEWYEAVMSYFNTNAATTNTNASAEAPADAGLVTGVNNLASVLSDFYRMIGEKQQRMRDYYQAEGVDASSVPDKITLFTDTVITALQDRIQAAFPSFDSESILGIFDGIGDRISERINIGLFGEDGASGLSTVGNSNISAVSPQASRTKIFQIQYLPTTTNPDDGLVTVRQLREVEEYFNSPEYTGAISIAALETLRRDPGCRSVVLG